MLQLVSLFFYLMAINILNLDFDFGNALGIGETAGGVFLTLILLLFVLALPIYKKSTTAIVFLSWFVLVGSAILGWISIFILFIPIALVSLGIAKIANDFLREHGGK